MQKVLKKLDGKDYLRVLSNAVIPTSYLGPIEYYAILLKYNCKIEIHENRATRFWHDVIEDSMLSHLEPATTLATRILQKIEKRLLKLKRKPYNSAAIAPVRVVKENSQKIIKSSRVSGHF